MKRILLIIALLQSINVFAQQRGNYGGGASQITGKVTGTIIDQETKEPVPYATVVVKSPETDETINGVITEADGSFKILNLKLGTYKLQVSFVGYSSVEQTIELTPKSPDINIENLAITTDTDVLDEVVVAGQREVIENKIDRIVYNAEQDVANAGGDASDVLRRAPLLSVDQDGNVSLRGNSNIQILINGKPSSMFGSSPGDALKMIPADQIKSVEVITSPSAKYDGEGTAGIINIITKKQTPQGFAGNVDMTVGTRINRGVVGLNAGAGRFGFNANASSFYSWPQTATNDFFQRSTNAAGEEFIREQNGGNLANRLGYFGNLGAFYDFNAFHSLSTSLRLRGFNSNSEGTNSVSEITPDFNRMYDRFTDNSSQNAGYEWSLDYIMKFPEQPGREFSASYKIDGNINNSQFEIVQDTPFNYEVANNLNDGNNRENTIQIDYVHPFGEKFKLETGFKSILRDIDSDFQYDSIPPESNNPITVDNRTDIFYYDQDVFAGYISSQYNITKKLGVIAGVRYEYTGLNGSFRDAQERDFERQDYENWLPSIIVNQKFGKFSSVKASYNRRIQRPSLRNVNPFEQIGNVRNVSFGNPTLNPEISDNFELGYNTFLKGTSFNFSVFYNQINQVIQSVVFEDTTRNLTVTNFENVGQQDNVGANLFISTELFKIWTIRGGINANYFMATGLIRGREVTNDALLLSGNINSSVKIKGGWIIDAFGFARPRQQTLQGFNPAFSIFGIGAKKEIWDKRGTIGISIIEPFQERKPFVSEINGNDLYQRSEFAVPFRSFGINFGYKFGKLDYKPRQRRTRISNDDQKGGDEGGQNF